MGLANEQGTWNGTLLQNRAYMYTRTTERKKWQDIPETPRLAPREVDSLLSDGSLLVSWLRAIYSIKYTILTYNMADSCPTNRLIRTCIYCTYITGHI